METSVLEECDASIFRIEEKTDFSTLMTAYSSEGKKHYCSQSPQLGLWRCIYVCQSTGPTQTTSKSLRTYSDVTLGLPSFIFQM